MWEEDKSYVLTYLWRLRESTLVAMKWVFTRGNWTRSVICILNYPLLLCCLYLHYHHPTNQCPQRVRTNASREVAWVDKQSYLHERMCSQERPSRFMICLCHTRINFNIFATLLSFGSSTTTLLEQFLESRKAEPTGGPLRTRTRTRTQTHQAWWRRRSKPDTPLHPHVTFDRYPTHQTRAPAVLPRPEYTTQDQPMLGEYAPSQRVSYHGLSASLYLTKHLYILSNFWTSNQHPVCSGGPAVLWPLLTLFSIYITYPALHVRKVRTQSTVWFYTFQSSNIWLWHTIQKD